MVTSFFTSLLVCSLTAYSKHHLQLQHCYPIVSVGQESGFSCTGPAAQHPKVWYPEVLSGWTASGFTYLVFGRVRFLEGYWLKVTLSSWPCEPLHGAVHIRVSEPGRRDRRREREREKHEGGKEGEGREKEKDERERQVSKTNRSFL